MPTTGPVRYQRRTRYQDIDNPNAALFHIATDDMDRAMQWFKSDVFKEASLVGQKSPVACSFLAEPQT
jgi:hypothetical protein